MTKPYQISKQLVWKAYQQVKANGGAAGVDRESLQAFEAKLKDNLYKLWNRFSSGSYFPPPVRGIGIPKKSGGVRMLGIPTVANRVAQSVVKMVLEPIVEPVFHEDSYGYRPEHSANHNQSTSAVWPWKRSTKKSLTMPFSPLVTIVFKAASRS